MRGEIHRTRVWLTTSEKGNWTVFFCALLLFALVAFLPSTITPPRLITEVFWPEQAHCRELTVGENPNAPAFLSHVMPDFPIRTLCEELATQKSLSSSYSAVEADWHRQDATLGHAIAERRLHLLLLRKEDPATLQPFFFTNFRPIAYYPAYDVRLIGRDTTPTLDSNYLLSRTIGLLTTADSRSGNIVPLTAFQLSGIDVSRLSIRRYPSHLELRRALDSGEVDLISSYWDEVDGEKFPDWRTLRIGEVREGHIWFLASALAADHETLCAVLGSVQNVAQQSPRKYFQDLIVEQDASRICNVN
jgi:phosphonate transport system substrate-binding protein